MSHLTATQLIQLKKHILITTILIASAIGLLMALPFIHIKVQKQEKIRNLRPRTPLGVIVDPYGYPVFTTTIPEHIYHSDTLPGSVVLK